MRLGLATRVFAIGAAGLLALWLMVVASFYWASDLPPASASPPPQQLAALVALADGATREQRALLLRAVRTALLDARIEPAGAAVPGADVEAEPALAPYRDLLGARLQAVRDDPAGEPPALPRPFAGRVVPREFWLLLDDGALLVVTARAPFAVTAVGLPAGVGAGFLGALVACLSLLLLHREMRPLAQLAAAADRMDPTGAPVALPHLKARTPELAKLVGALERLQARVHLMMRTRLALIGGIQHDVRSFATRLRLRLEHLPRPDERAQAAADIADMITLLDNALLTARAGVGALDEEMLDFAVLLEGEVADLRRAGRPVTLDLGSCPVPVWVLAHRLALRRVIGNIIDNAITYGARADLTLACTREVVRLDVRDEGPGFPPDLREALLEPFVRGEPSRARSTGGAGLGLAVARTLIEAHGGSIALGGAAGQGGRVTVTLPVFHPG